MPGFPVFADPELCSLESGKEGGSRLPRARPAPRISEQAQLFIGERQQACKGPARAMSLIGPDLGVDGCGQMR